MTRDSAPGGAGDPAIATSRQAIALWSSSQRLANVTGRLFAALTMAVALAFLTAQLLLVSTLAGLGGPAVPQMLFLVSIAAIATGALMALYEGQLLCVVAAGVIVALLVIQSYVFSWLTGAPVNLSVLLSYANMAAFPIFSLRTLKLDRVFAFLFVICLAYAAVYVAGYDHFVATAQAALDRAKLTKGDFGLALKSGGVRVLPDDSSRGLRVLLAGTFTSFAYFYALARLRAGRGWRWLMPMLLTGAAMFLSRSRTYIAVMALLTLAHLLRLSNRPQRVMAAGVFLAGTLVVLSGVAFQDLDPLGLLASDSSGAVRARAYRIIADLVAQNFVTGVGIAPSPEAAYRLVALPSVYWADLGVLGVWYTFGLFGLLLYCTQVVVVMVGYRLPAEMDAANQQTLLLSGLLIGLTAVLSPDIWGGGGGVISAIAIGLLLRQPTPPKTTPLWYFVGLLRKRGAVGIDRHAQGVSFRALGARIARFLSPNRP